MLLLLGNEGALVMGDMSEVPLLHPFSPPIVMGLLMEAVGCPQHLV